MATNPVTPAFGGDFWTWTYASEYGWVFDAGVVISIIGAYLYFGNKNKRIGFIGLFAGVVMIIIALALGMTVK